MSQEEIAAKEAEEKAAAEKAASDALKSQNPDDLVKQIAALNSENAARRLKEKELADKLEKFNTAQKEAEEKAAAEKGEYKGLWEEVKAANEAATAKVEVYEATLSKLLEAETANIPEDKRGLIPDGDVASQLAWIAKAKEAKLFEPVGGPGVRESGENPGDSLEVQYNEAVKSGNVQAAISLKKKIFDKQNRG